MRVCQSIGLRGGLPTPFYYCRNSDGVHVRGIRGENPQGWTIENGDWQFMLEQLSRANLRTFSIAQTDHPDAHPQSLYEIIGSALRNVAERDDRLNAYVCAILVHEGSLQLHHGKTVGPDARIVLRLADPNASSEEFSQ